MFVACVLLLQGDTETYTAFSFNCKFTSPILLILCIAFHSRSTDAIRISEDSEIILI